MSFSTLGGGVGRYATILAVDNARTLEDLSGGFPLAAESTVSTTSLELAVAIRVALACEVAARGWVTLTSIIALATISDELRATMTLALAVVGFVVTPMARAIAVSPVLPRVVLAIRVVFYWVRARITASDFHELADAIHRVFHPL